MCLGHIKSSPVQSKNRDLCHLQKPKEDGICKPW